MVINPWSVSAAGTDVLASQAFAASLFPYLGFLYYIGKEEVNCPKLANFGFRFLLVFVGASIPAGIYAKIHYHDILANIDWLHAAAESMLTLTNLFILAGFRNSIAASQNDPNASDKPADEASTLLKDNALFVIASAVTVAVLAAARSSFPALHAEPSNALSFPTWMIHVSSVIEWLAAIGLVSKFAQVTNNQRWRGLALAMVPLHSSGITACVYHLFYNAPNLNFLVLLQASLTLFGNGMLCIAAYRIFQEEKENSIAPAPSEASETTAKKPSGLSNMSIKIDPDQTFVTKLLVTTAVGSAVLKWGELYLDAPFQPTLGAALAVILVPSFVNLVKQASAPPSSE